MVRQYRNDILALLMVLAFVLSGCSRDGTPTTWQEQYDLGVRYLSEGNYEDAIIAFTAAIEIDPGRVESYVSMAEAYRQQGEYDFAYEILARGYEETQSERLKNMLKAEEANKVLSNNQELQESMRNLYQYLENRDAAAAADEFERWIRLNGDDPRFMEEMEEIDIAYSDLIFDGKNFYAKKEYDGIGLLFDTFSKIYYGEQSSGIPDGNGILLATNTWYQSGGVKYYYQSGTWEQGLSVGQAEITEGVTSDFQDSFYGKWEIDCVYDSQEVMSVADVTNIFVTDGQEHEYSFHVEQGHLLSSEWDSNPDEWYGNRITCQLHDNCRTWLDIDNTDNAFFENPWTWGGEVPADMNYFGQFSWTTQSE